MLKVSGKNQSGHASTRRLGEAGQTLIETIVAIFLLTTALSGGLALTIYALHTSQGNFNQIIAANLAREGVDVIRMMRDTNWLESDKRGGPWDLTACADIASKLCYPRAWTGVSGGQYHNYNISAGTYRITYDVGSKQWSIANNVNYNLYLQADGSYTHTVNGTAAFARKIVITENTAAPYSGSNSNSELIVQSIVGWTGKGCTAMTSQDPSTTNCKVIVEEHFTNWKDYK